MKWYSDEMATIDIKFATLAKNTNKRQHNSGKNAEKKNKNTIQMNF